METSASRQEDGNTAFWLYGVCSGGDGQRELVHAVSSASLRALGASHFLQKLLLQFSPKPSWQSRCATPRPSHPSPNPATTAPYAVRLALVVHLTCHATRRGYASSVPTRPPPKVALARTLAHALPRRSSPEHSGCAPTPPPPSPRPTPASSAASNGAQFHRRPIRFAAKILVTYTSSIRMWRPRGMHWALAKLGMQNALGIAIVRH